MKKLAITGLVAVLILSLACTSALAWAPINSNVWTVGQQKIVAKTTKTLSATTHNYLPVYSVGKLELQRQSVRYSSQVVRQAGIVPVSINARYYGKDIGNNALYLTTV